MLQRDRSQDAAVRPALQPLLRLERGLQAVRPVAVLHHAAGELVHELDAAVAHDVVDVAVQQGAGVERAVELGQERVVAAAWRFPQPSACSTRSIPASVSSTLRPYSSVSKCTPGSSAATTARQPLRRRGLRSRRARDHQRHARLVHQERVRLVHEREVEGPMDQPGRRRGPEVAQVVEARPPWP